MEETYAEIMRYLKLIVMRRYLFILVSLAVMSIIVWGSYFIPEKYEASSTIIIEKNVIKDLVKGIAITPSMTERIKVLRDVLLSRSLVLDVLRKLDLDMEAKNEQDLEKLILKYQESTKIKIKNKNLITVSIVHGDPIIARDYVNSLVNEYVEKNIFAKRQEAADATDFLKSQVEYFKEKMDKAEKEIIEFRKSQGIYVAMDERSVINDIKKFSSDIESLKMKRNELIATRQSLREQLKKEPRTVAIFSSSNMQQSIGGLEKKLAMLLSKYTENYPEVIRLKAEIETLRRQRNTSNPQISERSESEISTINPVYQDLKQQLLNIETKLTALNARERHLKDLIDQKKLELRQIPESKKKLADLQQERNAYRGVYERLLERLGQSEVSEQMEIEDKASTFRIIEPAIKPQIPVSPNRKRIILVGILLGFAAGFGLIFLLDYLDDSIKSVDTLKAFGLPVMAVIPTIKSEEVVKRTKRKDKLVFSMAGLYMMLILSVFAMEMLGLPYVDRFIAGIFLSGS
jgi:polysaccharide chain length determinant protein (PEP-CTERM system associated)